MRIFPQGQHFDAGLLFGTMTAAGIEYVSKKKSAQENRSILPRRLKWLWQLRRYTQWPVVKTC